MNDSPAAAALSSASGGDDLGRRTLRMVAILVSACVVFVGALSFVAFAVTSRVVSPTASSSDAPAAPAQAAKKPLSI